MVAILSAFVSMIPEFNAAGQPADTRRVACRYFFGLGGLPISAIWRASARAANAIPMGCPVATLAAPPQNLSTVFQSV
jgi:hypothetical protein